MKLCPYCQKAISVRAVKCPHCASVFDGMQMEIGRKQHSKRRNITIILSAVAVFAIGYMLIDGLFSPAAIQAAAERDAQREFDETN